MNIKPLTEDVHLQPGDVVFEGNLSDIAPEPPIRIVGAVVPGTYIAVAE